MSKKRSKTDGFMVVPLRVDPDMRKSVRTLAVKSKLSDADIMRMAIERGLDQVERMFAPEKQAA